MPWLKLQKKDSSVKMDKQENLNMEEYRRIFGSAKMQSLWLEFISEAHKYLNNIENEEAEKQQICFHNLRAYALVFDMVEFTDICTQMEENVIEFGAISSQEAEKVREILKKSILDVEQKLAG